MDAEAVKRSKQYAIHKYHAALEELVPEYQDRLAKERSELGTRGLVHSGPMAAITVRNSIELGKRQIQSRADALIDGFELNGIALDEEAQEEILKDVQDLRTTIVAARKNSASSVPGLRDLGMVDYFSRLLKNYSCSASHSCYE